MAMLNYQRVIYISLHINQLIIELSFRYLKRLAHELRMCCLHTTATSTYCKMM